jgi:hypothetical protein
MTRRKRLLWIGPLAIVGISVLVFIGGEIVMQLWNWLTPQLFGWHQITFWQAIGILLLCRILIGVVGGGPRGPSMRLRMGQRMMDGMTERMAERWERMTPEERERFRAGLRRCGIIPPNEATQL